MARKEFLQTKSYIEARAQAPWAVSLAYAPELQGFWAWEDVWEAQRDMAAKKPRGDLFISQACDAGGHVVRIYANVTPDEARVRASKWNDKGLWASFLNLAGQVVWSHEPKGSIG